MTTVGRTARCRRQPGPAFGIKPAVRGQIAYRVWFPADADHAQAFTANKILTVS
ncbi:hypothetical protein ACGFIF_12045 [Kribbella sp. NPDC049174]|uniref:hypothetical protein n=1 Tax=Kribbella sp. NPDC049174 TaxID=3364112 RepID=UPI00370FF453